MVTPVAIELRAADGVSVAGLHWPSADRRLGCVIAHGFTSSSRDHDIQAISAQLSGAGFGVLAIDFRGHGRSGGASTLGELEVQDLAAAVAHLRDEDYAAVAVLGWSMGGSVVLRYAGLGGDTDAVVSVSSPGHWYERGTRPLRIVHWVCETRTGRLVCRLVTRVRLAPQGWPIVPDSPLEVVDRIAPTPLLIVHGDADHYFPIRHAELMAMAAPEAELWIEPGMGHAESGTTPQLVDRIADWLRRVTSVPSSS
jgi:uncharacterized protein